MSLRWTGFLSIIVALVGAVGLQVVLSQLYPTTATKILLFGLLFITVSAVALPISAFLNHRFAVKDWRKRDPARLWRQSLGAGILALILAYLLLQHYLDWTIMAVLIGVFILMETFFITRK